MSGLKSVAGTEPGQRLLNGPQTTGRSYQNLSEANHRISEFLDQRIAMHDGAHLMADVFRPEATGPVPALLAVSCYPREIQNSGAPMGFVEAGATDFWVPRGYAHVIANTRSTGGSSPRYSWLDETERQDMADLVNWVAAQPWCDGNVGMIGISYFAMTQLAAAVEAPSPLKAIFPVAATSDPYEAVWHGGLLSETFVNSWIAGVATLADRSGRDFRNSAVSLLSKGLKSRRLHEKFAHMNGEAALAILGKLMRAKFPADPWGELLTAVTTDHPNKDEYWQQRDMTPLLSDCQIPTYLGCDWQNVPLHLPSTFALWQTLPRTTPVRMAMLGADGLTWPWESLHIEALAWFDHWLKGRDTGILAGPPIRYWLPGAEGFQTADQWPPTDTEPHTWFLDASGQLADEPAAEEGSRSLLHQGTLSKPKGAPPTDLPSLLVWETSPLSAPVDLVGPVSVSLVGSQTARETSWIVTLQDVDPAGDGADVTAGWRLSQSAELDEGLEIRLVDNARRFLPGHKIRLTVAADDTSPGHPAIMQFRHQAAGAQSRNTVGGLSSLTLSVRPSSGK